jgi:serine/threonine protein kinase
LKENCGQDQELFEQVKSLLDIDGTPSPLDCKTVSAFNAPDVIASRFRIIRYIAEGGMGTVYEAEDLQLHECVALKTIRYDITSDPKAVERFTQEISLGKRVTHPNVCRIHDLDVDRLENGTDAEARVQLGYAHRMDAGALIIHLSIALAEYYAKEYDVSIREAEVLRQQWPSHGVADEILADDYLGKNMPAAAIELLKQSSPTYDDRREIASIMLGNAGIMSYKFQPNNSCYNYVCNIATNSFALPGRSKGISLLIAPER